MYQLEFLFWDILSHVIDIFAMLSGCVFKFKWPMGTTLTKGQEWWGKGLALIGNAPDKLQTFSRGKMHFFNILIDDFEPFFKALYYKIFKILKNLYIFSKF